MPPSASNESSTFFVAAVGLLGLDRAAADHRRDVERERPRRPDVRLAEPAEQHAQHRVGVGRRADRRAGVGAHPLLVDEDRRGQSVEQVDVGTALAPHEALDERAVGLVDEPLRLGGDRAEDEARLARSGDPGEHRQAALRDLDADVFEVVLAGTLHPDEVVAVGGVAGVSRHASTLPRAADAAVRSALNYASSADAARPPSRRPSSPARSPCADLLRALELGAEHREAAEADEGARAGKRDQHDAESDGRAADDADTGAVGLVGFRILADRASHATGRARAEPSADPTTRPARAAASGTALDRRSCAETRGPRWECDEHPVSFHLGARTPAQVTGCGAAW